MSPLIVTSSTANFDSNLRAAVSLALVDFWGPRCAPCRALEPMLADLAAEYSGRIAFFTVNVETEMVLARRFAIRGVPTLLLYRNGEPIGPAPTGSRSALRAALEEALKGGTDFPVANRGQGAMAETGTGRTIPMLMELGEEIREQLVRADPTAAARFDHDLERALDRIADPLPALGRYYLWLRDNPEWGLTRYVSQPDDRVLFERMIELQARGDPQAHRTEWVALFEEMMRFADDADRIYLGNALTPLEDLARSSLVGLHRQLEKLARSARRNEFSLAAAHRLLADIEAALSPERSANP